MNAKKLNRIMRAKRSRIGRIVCRLLGDEKGAVTMEYVILAVLIAARRRCGYGFRQEHRGHVQYRHPGNVR